jgi:putative ABC transport system permease protein
MLALTLILSLIGITLSYTFETSERMKILTTERLEDQWRTEYDLLVSPESSPNQNNLNKKDLVRRSNMTNHYGGISIEQYHQIKSIPGVQVAAPLSFIGYISTDGMQFNWNVDEPGFYLVTKDTKVFDGIRYRDVDYTGPLFNETELVYQYFSQEQSMEIGDEIKSIIFEGEWIPTSTLIGEHMRSYGYFWTLVGIDPQEEIKLYNLDQAIVEGELLPTQDELLFSDNGVPVLPLMLSKQTYNVQYSTALYKLDVDPNLTTKEIINKGGADYLRTLPKEKLGEYTFNPYDEEHLFFFGTLEYKEGQVIKHGYDFGYSNSRDFYQMGPIQYQFKGEMDGNPFYEAVPVDMMGEQVNYRTLSHELKPITYGIDLYGLFDPQGIESKHATSKEPKDPDFYNPEKVYYTHNERGDKYKERIKYENSPFKQGYYIGGADAITTLNGAKLFLGDKPISVIRVVVEGAGERNAESLAKVEKVAQMIREQTQLHVDVMLGAADRKVEVKLNGMDNVPGYGYVLEGWSQAGSSLVIEDQVNYTNLLLGVYIVLIGVIGVSIILRYYSEIRKKDISILYTFGWTKAKIIFLLFMETFVLLSLVLVLCILANQTLASDWNQTTYWIIVIGSLILSLMLSAIFYIVPLINNVEGSRTLRSSGERIYNVSVAKPMISLWGLIPLALLRNPTRSLLKALVIFVTVIYIFIFLLTKGSGSSFLWLTFLGESIDLILTPQQWALFGVGIGLSVAAYFAIQVNQMEKRVKEIQLFKVWGWQNTKWLKLYIFEEMAISLFSIFAGALVGFLLLTIVKGEESLSIQSLGWTVLVTTMATITLLIVSIIMRTKRNQLREFN